MPFKQTAICLSGGGYRAASFHLGTLSYLRRIHFRDRPLIEYIKVLSTISGGSFTGVLYAHSVWESQNVVGDTRLQTDEEFATFYHALKDFMADEDLIEAGLNKLKDRKEWKSERRRNVINSFAKVYQEKLFGLSENRSFNLFYQGKTHLEEVIFNATEFDYGLAFRFQKTLDDEGIIGNWFRRIPSAAAKELRLGDIIASSSCFPAGFAPLAFPQDYIGPDNQYLTRLRSLETLKEIPREIESDRYMDDKPEAYIYPEPMALMDGGIVDNQGVESIILSEKRRAQELDTEDLTDPVYSMTLTGEKDRKLDLIIISDVASPFLVPLKLASRKDEVFTGIQNSSIERLYKILTLTGLLALLLIIPVILSGLKLIELSDPVKFLLLVPGVAVGTIALLLLLLIRYFNRNIIKQQVPAYFQKYLHYFTHLRVYVLEPMLRDRISSVLKMVNDIFLKQIRRLTYAKIYDDANWDYRRIANIVYELRPSEVKKNLLDRDNKKRAEEGKPVIKYPDVLRQPSPKLQEVAENASDMGTTLWFTPEDRGIGVKHGDRLKDLVTDGQFTICYNLLVYLCELRAYPEAYNKLEWKDDLDRLFENLMADWEHFNNHPHWLYEKFEHNQPK
ncbi:patatin-like phospholipase family protein [Flavilitoribacter nigricans]|nr:patatin-like phospholipase family protein [Flavilitoribacter nigricans]